MAELLGCSFLDLDEEIEARLGKSISAIFAEEGEDAFRREERALTDELAGRPGMVLAPGGGWMSREGNVSALRPPARLIHLVVSVETAIRRLGEDVELRPLLAGTDPTGRLEQLAASRLQLYGMADAAIDTQMLSPQQVAQEAVLLATRWGWPIG